MDNIKIIKACRVWNSAQNGLVYGLGGVAPTVVSGTHSGAEPKVLIIEDEW